MSFLTRISDAVQSWRRRRAGTKSPKRAAVVRLEQLDHRQLLAVNFTGNVPIDFPATSANNGVVIFNRDPNVPGNSFYQVGDPSKIFPATIPAGLQPYFQQTGLDVQGIRISYDATADTLSIGIEQPTDPSTGKQVIAGDVDNNGDSANLSTSIPPSVVNSNFDTSVGSPDPADLQGRESIAAVLSLKNNGTPDIFAGYPLNPAVGAKTYQVGTSTVNGNPANPVSGVDLDTPLPQFRGDVYLVNDPNHPNLEFRIKNFSQLYQQTTGAPLTADSIIQIGGKAVTQATTITEATFPLTPFTIRQVTPPTPGCPPIKINPHEGTVIDSAHASAVRAYIFSTATFDATTIDPSTVRLGNPADPLAPRARPVLNFNRDVNGDGRVDAVYVFSGLDINLPSGNTTAEISGVTSDGMAFSSQANVINRDSSFYSQAARTAQEKRFVAYARKNGLDIVNGVVPTPPPKIPAGALRLAGVRGNQAARAAAASSASLSTSAPTGNTVKIKRAAKATPVAGAAAAQRQARRAAIAQAQSAAAQIQSECGAGWRCAG